jgi:hypothetical protein
MLGVLVSRILFIIKVYNNRYISLAFPTQKEMHTFL